MLCPHPYAPCPFCTETQPEVKDAMPDNITYEQIANASVGGQLQKILVNFAERIAVLEEVAGNNTFLRQQVDLAFQRITDLENGANPVLGESYTDNDFGYRLGGEGLPEKVVVPPHGYTDDLLGRIWAMQQSDGEWFETLREADPDRWMAVITRNLAHLYDAMAHDVLEETLRTSLLLAARVMALCQNVFGEDTDERSVAAHMGNKRGEAHEHAGY